MDVNILKTSSLIFHLLIQILYYENTKEVFLFTNQEPILDLKDTQFKWAVEVPNQN